MPTLIVEQIEHEQDMPAGSTAAGHAGGAVLRKTRRAGKLSRRVLVGRLPCCGIRCDDSAVSRLHAWFTHDNDGDYIFDGGSLTGTLLNGQAISQRTRLKEGDQIRIGQTTICYSAKSELPRDAQAADLENAAHGPPATFGVMFDCICGAPAWVKWASVGKPFHCRHCGHTVLPPAIPGAKARRAASDSIMEKCADHHSSVPAVQIAPHSEIHTGHATSPAGANGDAAAQTCSICHTSIAAHDAQTTCPECGLTFHSQCWKENYGCSAYGCSQVNVLKPPQAVEHAPEAAVEAQEAFPWEYILLAGSALCVLLSALTFGGASALAGIASLAYLFAGRPRRRGLVMVAAAISVVGIAAGVLASMVLWSHSFTWQGK